MKEYIKVFLSSIRNKKYGRLALLISGKDKPTVNLIVSDVQKGDYNEIKNKRCDK